MAKQKLYLFRDDTGAHKIGISVNPQTRAYHVQMADRRPNVVVVRVFRVGDRAAEMERLAHKILCARRVPNQGEWFYVTEAMCVDAIEQARRVVVHNGHPLLWDVYPNKTRGSRIVMDEDDQLTVKIMVAISPRMLRGVDEMCKKWSVPRINIMRAGVAHLLNEHGLFEYRKKEYSTRTPDPKLKVKQR